MAQAPSFTTDQLAAAHARLIADRSIQHALPDAKSPPIPAWVKALAQAIRAAWPVLRILVWVALAAAAIALLWLVGSRLLRLGWPGKARTHNVEEALAWQPDAAVARGLLQEADALAAAGHYAEAARLVLHRSIEDVERRRPALVRPATTSRDLAALGTLPDAARPAFAAIAAIVERSLFADHAADCRAWSEARAAYASFARVDRW